MSTFSDLEAKTEKAKKSKETLRQRVERGAQQQKEAIEKVVKTVISDRLWYPKKINLHVSDGSILATYEEEHDKTYRLHKHALRQMAGVTEMGARMVSSWRDAPQDETHGYWKQEMLCYCINEIFTKGKFLTRGGQEGPFLRRAVGNEVRGFQSRNFKRNLATAPLLRAFVEQCALHQAGPVEATTSDIRMHLKCMLPYVFEPVDGEFVAFGASFGNSDFGAGKLSIAATLMRVSSGTISVLEDKFSKIHLGKTIEAGDDVELCISDETRVKELEAHKSAIKDVVDGVFNIDQVDRSLRAIQAAHENGIEWYRLRTSLVKVLNKKQIEFVKNLLDAGDDLIDLPSTTVSKDGDPMATGWWAANVVGFLATKEENEDKKHELQQLAGTLLGAKAI